MDIFRQTLQCHGASCCIPHQALQLVTPMGWHLGVGVQGKPVDTGAARTRACGTLARLRRRRAKPFPFITKARANPSNFLSGPFPKGDALFDRGRQGASEFGIVVEQRIIPRGHGVVDARLQVSQPTQRADDPPADRLDYRGNVGITGRLALEKARREALVGPIKIDPLKEDNMKMYI